MPILINYNGLAVSTTKETNNSAIFNHFCSLEIFTVIKIAINQFLAIWFGEVLISIKDDNLLERLVIVFRHFVPLRV